MEQSGASRALTLADPITGADSSIRATWIGHRHADRLRNAGRSSDLVEDGKASPISMLSGVNRGQNIAEDVTMSGTVAGAMEAMAPWACPAIALSQALTKSIDDGAEGPIGRRPCTTFAPGVIANG